MSMLEELTFTKNTESVKQYSGYAPKYTKVSDIKFSLFPSS